MTEIRILEMSAHFSSKSIKIYLKQIGLKKIQYKKLTQQLNNNTFLKYLRQGTKSQSKVSNQNEKSKKSPTKCYINKDIIILQYLCDCVACY